MWQARIICVGRIKNSTYADIQSDYLKRLSPAPDIIELEGRKRSAIQSNQDILNTLSDKNPVFALDEQGENFSSRQFADAISRAVSIKPQPVQFIIGPADGLSEEIRAKADKLISFGRMTWPHLLTRILLLEQIYRAQSIMSGHPYHRD